ncbi:MAG TPA: HEPN domain-containing protein [Candidatus Bilamarchaeaceae archaeon]|nr:HEPN domain-containing protein [Candidatus Bilamarchaeaceae archaeon]
MSLDDCFKRHQLRKTAPDIKKAEHSVVMAELKIQKAKSLLDEGFFDMSLVNAYMAMFHLGRALLFKDGVIEKSHYCLVEYLRQEYSKKNLLPLEIVTMLDAFREQRHDIFYGLEEVTVEEKTCILAIENAGRFLKIVEDLLK